MLRNLIQQAIRARGAGSPGTPGARGGYGRTSRGSGSSDPGAMAGAQIGRRVFAALRRRG